MSNPTALPPLFIGYATPPKPSNSPQVRTWNAPRLSHIRKANKEAGLFWFRPDTMAFFHSKVGRYFGQGVFTTSEKSGFRTDSPRRYSVRVADTQGQVHTFGAFLGYEKAGHATAIARRLAAALGQGKEVLDSQGSTYASAV
jgi:hypothetical protein